MRPLIFQLKSVSDNQQKISTCPIFISGNLHEYNRNTYHIYLPDITPR